MVTFTCCHYEIHKLHSQSNVRLFAISKGKAKTKTQNHNSYSHHSLSSCWACIQNLSNDKKERSKTSEARISNKIRSLKYVKSTNKKKIYFQENRQKCLKLFDFFLLMLFLLNLFLNHYNFWSPCLSIFIYLYNLYTSFQSKFEFLFFTPIFF